MGTRKSNGEGSISKYKNGWRASIMIGREPSTGKAIRKVFYGKTKKEVNDKMNKLKLEYQKGNISNDDKMTLGEWYHIWIADFKINEVKSSTIERYDSLYRNYIKDYHINQIKLKDLRTPIIQRHYNKLLEIGASSYTIKMLNNKVLKPCLKAAIRFEYIFINHCENISLPKEKNTITKKDAVFSEEEQIKLLNFLNKGSNKYGMIILLAFASGLRIGELIPLRWSDIDFPNNTISVNKGISSIYKTVDGKRTTTYIETTPKTLASIRGVPIPSKTTECLKIYKKNQEKLKSELEGIYKDDDYVFADELGRRLLSNTVSKGYKKALKEAGIPHRKFHSIRHSYATRLFEKGIPIKTVQELLGHTSIRMTADIYTHVMDEEKVSAVQTLNDLF